MLFFAHITPALLRVEVLRALETLDISLAPEILGDVDVRGPQGLFRDVRSLEAIFVTMEGQSLVLRRLLRHPLLVQMVHLLGDEFPAAIHVGHIISADALLVDIFDHGIQARDHSVGGLRRPALIP